MQMATSGLAADDNAGCRVSSRKNYYFLITAESEF